MEVRLGRATDKEIKQTKFPWQEKLTSPDLKTHVEIQDNKR